MSYVDYSNATTAEKDILIIRDAIIPIFQQSVRLGNLAVGGTLPDVPNVYASLVQENSEQYFYRDMFNSVIYRAHMFLLSVRCEYTMHGDAVIPMELALRWKIQAHKSYERLSEQEKQSDRDEVAHILPIIDAYRNKETF